MARETATRTCIIDASALYTLSLLSGEAQTLLALVGRPAVTDAGLYDLVAAEDHFNAPSSGTVTFDTHAARVIPIRRDDESVARQQDQIRQMLTRARYCRKINHPALLHQESWDADREPVWLINLDAAKETGASLWADDLGLRAMAHQLGVPTFGTDSILRLARERARITDTQHTHITRRLIHEYVVDLPFDKDSLLAVAGEQHWEARSVAFILSRPQTWTNLAASADLFLKAFRQAPEEAQAGWAYAAFKGLHQAIRSEHRTETLAALAAATLCEAWARPDHAKALITGLTLATPDEADTITRTALDRVWKQLKDTYGNQASTVMLHVISRLEAPHRQHGVSLILQA